MLRLPPFARRMTLTLLLCLLLGSLITIASAWWAMYRADAVPQRNVRPRTLNSFQLQWPSYLADAGFPSPTSGTEWEGIKPWIDMRTISYFRMERLGEGAGAGELWPVGVALTQYEAGWPCRALHFDQFDGGGDELAKSVERVRSRAGLWEGWSIDGVQGRNGAYTLVLPLAPIFPGFLLDTLFFTALLATPLSVSPLRRHWRIRRGLCAACGYDLRGNPAAGKCPECGVECVARTDRLKSHTAA